MSRRGVAVLLAAAMLALLTAVGASAIDAAAGVGVVDPTTGMWYLRDPATGATTSFYYGDPGDAPFVGDWDCDGIDTPGLYRRSDGYVYLRNTNTEGIADVAFFFGNPGDVPVPGDFDGDGCDTVSIYRPAEAVFFVINRLGTGDAGLGVADAELPFGDIGDQPIAGDFDGDGIDTIGVARAGVAYLQEPGGTVDVVAFGERGDTALVGAWSGDVDRIGAHRPFGGAFSLTTPEATVAFAYGFDRHLAIAGSFGPLPGGGEAPPAQPPYPAVGSGKRIIYSDSAQRVWLVNDDGSLATTHLVSGKRGVPAAGTYAVYSKSVDARSYNGITMTHMVRFAHGRRLPYGFHSIPRYATGEPMQTEAELGYYRSGGCVRQAYDDAVFLYDWAPIGTIVHVIP